MHIYIIYIYIYIYNPELHQASNIGTEHFVGQAGAAAEGGVSVAMYEWSAGGPLSGIQNTVTEVTVV